MPSNAATAAAGRTPQTAPSSLARTISAPDSGVVTRLTQVSRSRSAVIPAAAGGSKPDDRQGRQGRAVEHLEAGHAEDTPDQDSGAPEGAGLRLQQEPEGAGRRDPGIDRCDPLVEQAAERSGAGQMEVDC